MKRNACVWVYRCACVYEVCVCVCVCEDVCECIRARICVGVFSAENVLGPNRQ